MLARMRGFSPLLCTLLLMAACLAGWQSFVRAPGSAATAFPAEEAYATLSRLLAEQVPHPVGSAANQRIRDRLLQELRDMGYAPEVQSAFVCDGATCTQVENVIAVLKGNGSGRAILAAAHYDSVAAGPGTGDDGVGVAAVLEVARLLQREPPARNDVIFLFTDGEEVGMRGAQAFVRHPLFESVELVINLDARGTSGPAVMFETGEGNRALIAHFARHVAAPVSTSVAYELYRMLPNDTDFTIYRREGRGGFNLAMIESAGHYHTGQDTLASLDRNSLRHYGDQLLALLAAARPLDLGSLKAGGDASYFDIFGATLVHWPAALNLPLAVLAAVMILGWLVLRWPRLRGSDCFITVLVMLALPLVLAVAGWLLSYPLGRWPDVPPVSHPWPWPARISLVATLIAAALLAARLLASLGVEAVTSTVWLVTGALAVTVAALVPGAAYLLLWPALLFGLVLWVARAAAPGRAVEFAAIGGAALSIFFWSAFPLALDAVFGYRQSLVKLAALFPMAMALVPVFRMAHRNLSWQCAVLAGVALAGAAVASQVPGRTRDHPEPLNLLYYQDAAGGAAMWAIHEAGVDSRFLQEAGLAAAQADLQIAGLSLGRAYLRDAEDIRLPAPAFTVLEKETLPSGFRLHATLKAARAGEVLGVHLPRGTGLRALRVDGQEVAIDKMPSGPGTLALRIHGIGDRVLPLEIDYDGAPLRLVAFERSPLPDSEEALRLAQLRPPHVAPLRTGDGAQVFRVVEVP